MSAPGSMAAHDDLVEAFGRFSRAEVLADTLNSVPARENLAARRRELVSAAALCGYEPGAADVKAWAICRLAIYRAALGGRV